MMRPPVFLVFPNGVPFLVYDSTLIPVDVLGDTKTAYSHSYCASLLASSTSLAETAATKRASI